MENESEMSMHEMKIILEEANLLEDNMSSEEINETCRIILQSKSAVEEESNASKLMVSQTLLIEAMEDDVNTTPNLEMEVVERAHDSKNNLVENENERSQDLVAQDATKFVFGFNDMPKSTGSMLDIIEHVPKYILIQSTEEFLNAGKSEKAKIIYQYHTQMNQLKTKIAKLSFNPAPKPKEIILAELNFPTSSEEDDDETYISRSGRHTKRKQYCDYGEETSDVGLHKKTKTGILRKPLNKLIKKEEDVPTLEVEPPLEKEVPSVDAKPKKLTNAEIISRSSLFSDSPRQAPRSRPTRTEAMFDKLRESEKQKQKSEKEMERFDKSLWADKEDEPQKVRVIPPLPGRKPINERRTKAKEPPALNINIKPLNKCNSTEDQQDPTLGDFVPFRRRPWLSKNKNPTESTSQATSSKKASSNDVICPICSERFSQSKIEDHASACGD